MRHGSSSSERGGCSYVDWFGTRTCGENAWLLFPALFKAAAFPRLVIFREPFHTSHKYLGWLVSSFFLQLCVYVCVCRLSSHTLVVCRCLGWSHPNNSWLLFSSPSRNTCFFLKPTSLSHHVSWMKLFSCPVAAKHTTCDVWLQSDLMETMVLRLIGYWFSHSLSGS